MAIVIAVSFGVASLVSLAAAIRVLFGKRVERDRSERTQRIAVWVLVAIGAGVMSVGLLISDGDVSSPYFGISLVSAVIIGGVVPVLAFRIEGHQMLHGRRSE
ncbi:hypothetical protein GCM10011354_36110 [Egicoccus halophilus]|uniref:Uncharacterized protein n=1 Tax=Egicoccus halophilus TaxID=1670830 RepID=A0A8J3ADT3_9ACTN|nr:hypothetical protein GCM10011354_36110 [Egicoccus halophilus]